MLPLDMIRVLESKEPKHPCEPHSNADLVELIERLEEAEEERLCSNPKIERLPKLIRTLLFDVAYQNSHTPESDVKILAKRWECDAPGPPPIWRIEIWKRLLGAKLYPALSISVSKDLSAYGQGVRQGAWACLLRVYEKTLSKYPLASSARDLLSISDLLLDTNHLEGILIRREREFTVDYLEGLQKGFSRFTTDSGNAVQKNSIQDIYFVLIEFSDSIGKMDTVEDIYVFLKKNLKNGFPHQFTTFARRCTEIKLQGTKYREKQSK